MDLLLLTIKDGGCQHRDGGVRIYNAGNETVIVKLVSGMDATTADGSTITIGSSIVMETVATQTDKCEDDVTCADFYNASLAEVPLTELDLGTELDCEEDLNRTIDFEYEEVTICRNGPDQKVGLTLCYGSACNDITDIYVGEVDPTGIAAKDGRIREGDQILQINGCDVHTRQEAIRMFSESRSAVTLLLARPAVQMDDGFMEIYNRLDDLRNKLDGVEVQSGPAPHNETNCQGICYTTDNNTSVLCPKLDRKPAAVEQRLDSRNDKVKQESVLGLPKSPMRNNQKPSSEVERFSQGAASCSFNQHLAYADAATNFDSEIEALNREMQRIQLQYQEIINIHRPDHQTSLNDHLGGITSKLDALRSPRLVPRMGTRLDYIRQLHMASEQLSHVTTTSQKAKTSPKRNPPPPTSGRGSTEQDTSAYNTAESSCRSTPAAALDVLVHAENSLNVDGGCCGREKGCSCASLALSSDTTLCEEPVRESNVGNDHRRVESTSRTSQTNDRGESLQTLYNRYIDVMYTNKANLQHTIMVQQNLFQQQLTRCSPVKNESKVTPSSSPSKSKGSKPSASPSVQTGDCSTSRIPSAASGQRCCTEMEWVVKRRADGSRYITRRPVRNRILKERARKLAEERCGLTTDDDAVSELKVGRYWSKEERKRHLEKARNHRRQKEILLQQQLENNREKMEVRKELSAVELGHRKHLRHKSKKALDDFTTLQELLVHGSRESQGKAYNALLSVTTV